MTRSRRDRADSTHSGHDATSRLSVSRVEVGKSLARRRGTVLAAGCSQRGATARAGRYPMWSAGAALHSVAASVATAGGSCSAVAVAIATAGTRSTATTTSTLGQSWRHHERAHEQGENESAKGQHDSPTPFRAQGRAAHCRSSMVDATRRGCPADSGAKGLHRRRRPRCQIQDTVPRRV